MSLLPWKGESLLPYTDSLCYHRPVKIGRPEKEHELVIPIAARISELADEYRDWLYSEIGGRNKRAST